MKLSSFVQNIKKILMGVIVLAMLNFATSCGVSRKDIPSIVESMLQEKYSEEFVATSMGNRYDTGSATLYCHPVGNEEVNFTATYTNSTESITDDFIDRKNAVQIDSVISNTLKENGFDGQSLTIFYGSQLDNIVGNESLEEFILKSNTERLYIHLVLNSNVVRNVDDAQKFIDAFMFLSQKYNNIDILLVTYMLEADDYIECSQKLQEKPSVKDDWIKSFNVIENFVFQIRDNEAETTASELFNNLKR